MEFISTSPQVKTHLQVWSGELQLLTCNIYFWNPGSSAQKSQIGLLSTILYQLLSQRPDLCRRVAPRRYLYFQLAGADSPDPPDWTLEELRDSVTRLVFQIKDTSRLALFVDGLDEYDGDLDRLISFLKRLHHDYNVKLCVSSRPWNTFKDEFHTYPSLRMELLTKPDIVKYVCTRIGGSLAFNELRNPHPTSVENLESQIIEKADGVFLWVVLVVENVIATARENNVLRESWGVFESMPPGLEELYGSMRRRLDQTQRERASRMYQLLFRWNKVLDRSFETLEFRMAINCRHPTEPLSYPEAESAGIRPALERQLAGATGGILQIHTNPRRHGSSARAFVGFLHRTVFDWLQGMKSSIETDGPTDFDPGLVLTSVLVSRQNLFLGRTNIAYGPADAGDVFAVGQCCRPSPEARPKLLHIIDRVQLRRSDGKSLRSSYLNPMEAETLSSYSVSTVRSYPATRHLCAPYLQAKLESSPGVTGLELAQKLHLLLTAFWKSSQKRLVTLILDALFDDNDLQGEPLRILNRRLGTFETLLQAQSPFTTHGGLRPVIKEKAEYGTPREFWNALKAGVEGKGFVELTSISVLGQEEPLDDPSPEARLRSLTSIRGRRATMHIRRGFREYTYS